MTRMPLALPLALPLMALLAACSPQGDGKGADTNGSDPKADAAKPATVAITRLDCGTIEVADLNIFSQAGAYPGQTKTLVDSCYLIRHGDTLMLWDAGLPGDLKGKDQSDGPFTASLTATIVEQLGKLGLTADDIDVVGISHYHFDHVGQLADFPNAKLVLGAGDWSALRAASPDGGIDTKPYTRWLADGGISVQVKDDYDLFDDGSVTVLAMPGHTPGHLALKLKADDGRTIMLTGDLAHFRENYANNGVPTFNTDAAQTVASLKRFKAIAKDEGAVVVIQHEQGDLGKITPAGGVS